MTVCGAFPRQARRALLLRESKVISVREDAGAVRILLSAYLQVSSGEPGQAAGTAWERPVAMILRAGRLLEAPPAALWITGGTVTVGADSEDLLALPYAREGAVRVELSGAEGRLVATGTGLVLEEQGEPRFIERTGDALQ